MHAHAGTKGRCRRWWWVLILGLLFSPGPAWAQDRQDKRPWQVEPVFSQNAVDGTLLGLRGSYELFGFRPEAALGYGLGSGRVRYRAGLGWEKLVARAYDWPESPLLGRTGESGLELVLGRGTNVFALALARPWALEGEDEAPQVRYLHGRNTHRWEGPFDLSLVLSTELTLGLVASGGAFESQERRLQARWGDVRLSWADGTASNAAGLKGFAFAQRMRGYDESLKGEGYWRLRLERRVPLLAFPVELPELPVALPGPAADFLENLDFRVEASAYGEVLQVRPAPSAVEPDLDLTGPQSRLGWAVGLVFSLGKFEFRVDLFFNGEGQMTHLFG